MRFAFSPPSPSALPARRAGGVCGAVDPLPLFLSKFKEDKKNVGQELRSAASGGGQWSGVGGLSPPDCTLDGHTEQSAESGRGRTDAGGEAETTLQCSASSNAPSVRQRECRNYPSSLTSSPTQSVSWSPPYENSPFVTRTCFSEQAPQRNCISLPHPCDTRFISLIQI